MTSIVSFRMGGVVKSESVLVSGWDQVGFDCGKQVNIKNISITFSTGKTSAIVRYDVPREGSLPVLGWR